MYNPKSRTAKSSLLFSNTQPHDFCVVKTIHLDNELSYDVIDSASVEIIQNSDNNEGITIDMTRNGSHLTSELKTPLLIDLTNSDKAVNKNILALELAKLVTLPLKIIVHVETYNPDQMNVTLSSKWSMSLTLTKASDVANVVDGCLRLRFGKELTIDQPQQKSSLRMGST
jgi:hypothetical protein